MSTPLRPMSTSEILDRAFSLYRNNFALFAGIAILPAILKLILDLVRLSSNVIGLQVGAIGLSASSTQSEGFGGPFLLLIIYLLGSVLATGATVYAVSMVYLGKSATIAGSYGAIGPKILRLIGLFLLLFIVLIGVGMVVIGIPAYAAISARSFPLLITFMVLGFAVLVHLYICFSVAPAACVVENARVIQAFNRSQALTKGSRGRIWLVFLLYFVLSLALGFVIGALAAIIIRATGSIMAGAICLIGGQFLVGVFLGPIFTLPLILVYYDQRVRKEAFDLQLMMESLSQPQAQAAAAPASPTG
jgi:hypothetical protein